MNGGAASPAAFSPLIGAAALISTVIARNIMREVVIPERAPTQR